MQITLHIKHLEKEEQTEPKISGRKESINIPAGTHIHTQVQIFTHQHLQQAHGHSYTHAGAWVKIHTQATHTHKVTRPK